MAHASAAGATKARSLESVEALAPAFRRRRQMLGHSGAGRQCAALRSLSAHLAQVRSAVTHRGLAASHALGRASRVRMRLGLALGTISNGTTLAERHLTSHGT